MPATYIYPLSNASKNEVPLQLCFDVANYSLKNFERTRDSIISRSLVRMVLPMPKEPGYSGINLLFLNFAQQKWKRC